VNEENDLLEIARSIVRGDRQKDYGNPEDNLTRIGIVWGALLMQDAIPPRTVALMLAGMKLVRASNRDNRDDFVDAVGYLVLADESGQK